MSTSVPAARWTLAGLLILVAVSPGCSAFKGSRKLDMTPFAENTSLMFAEAAKVTRPFNAVYLRPYADIPEIPRIRSKAEPTVRGLRALVLYSNQVVALNLSSKSDKEKNRLLADYLEEATNGVATKEKLQEFGLSPAGLDSVLHNVRTADAFLDGVREASALANLVVRAILSGLDGISEETPALIQAFDDGIERRFREKRAAYEGLTRLQARYMRAVVWLYEAKSGSAAATDSLYRLDASMQAVLPTGTQWTPDQFAAAETELVERLDRIGTLIEDLSYDRNTYLATHKELAELRVNLDQRIKVARDAVVIWGQSHRNLGLGVPVPPLVNLSAIASGATKAVPFP